MLYKLDLKSKQFHFRDLHFVKFVFVLFKEELGKVVSNFIGKVVSNFIGKVVSNFVIQQRQMKMTKIITCTVFRSVLYHFAYVDLVK